MRPAANGRRAHAKLCREDAAVVVN